MSRDYMFQAAPIITKSKYLIGLQCLKYLWIKQNRPQELPQISQAQERIFEQGQFVGEFAKKLYPEGVDIPYTGFKESIEQTKKLLPLRKTLFEASILAGRYYSRIDILEPADGQAWNIIEVKSATSLNEVYYFDVAFQRYCLEQAGMPVARCYLMHINNQYVRQGEIEPDQLFIKEDITKRSEEYLSDIKANLSKMEKTISEANCPEIKIGLHCNSPYECALKEICWNFLPEDNLFTLYRVKKAEAYDLLASGLLDIKDLPDDFNLNLKQQIQRKCLRSNNPYINKEEIAEFIDSLEFPLYFLDFETFGGPVPLYDYTRPYQQVPFQFSLHILESFSAKPTHHSYLADGKKDPRPEILQKLKNLLGSQGTIIAYNMSFEINRLKESAEAYKEYQDWVFSLIPRFVDLLSPFRNFSYYHPRQKGSASIKNIAFPLTGKSYEGMEIADGGTASAEYARVTFEDANEEERKRVYQALLKYCEFDTRIMIDILYALRDLISS